MLPLLLAACAPGTTSTEPECSTPESCADSSPISTSPPPFVVGTVRAARYPIVLHHGFNASSTNSWSYYKVKAALEADGHVVVVTEGEPFNGVEVRAASLAKIVDRARIAACERAEPAQPLESCLTTMKVNLVAHSMGGLDARYLAARLGYSSEVASITTISTPQAVGTIECQEQLR